MNYRNPSPARTALGAFVFLGFFTSAAFMDAGVLTAQTSAPAPASKPAGIRGGGPGGEARAGRPQEFDFTAWNTLLKKYTRNGLVDYAAWKKAGTAGLDEALSAMAAHPYAKVFSREARLAYLINVYNAYVVRSILDAYPVGSVMDIKGFFDTAKHPLSDGEYTLDEIEKTLIKGTFADVPEYHFGLVCGGMGCPPLRDEAYTGAGLNGQLATNARAFLTDPKKSRFDAEKNVLHLSEIFRWYKDDFESADRSIYRIVAAQYSLSDAMRIMKDEPAIEYIPFDWKLNDAGAE